MRNSVTSCVLGLAGLVMMIGGSAASASVRARYVRVEAPVSLRVALQQIEIDSGGHDVALHNHAMGYAASGVTPGAIGDDDHARKMIQGRPANNARGTRVQAVHGTGAWMEFDLHHEMPIDRLVIHRGTSDGYRDRFYRIVSLLDENRRVVFYTLMDIRKPESRDLTNTINTQRGSGPYLGTVVPPGADGWMPMGHVVSIEPASQAPDAASRRFAFEHRNDPQEVASLAQRFFGVMDLAKPELADVASLYRTGQFQAALDAYRDRFLTKKVQGLIDTWGQSFESVHYPGQAEDLLEGKLITVSRTVFGVQYKPGTMDWAALPSESSPRFEAALAIAKNWANVNNFQDALLDAYARTGDVKYLHQWSVMTDDWAMHYFRDADRSPYNLRDYFVKEPLQAMFGFCERLGRMARQHPQFVQQMPSATLARLLLPVLEEYPPAYWRVARKTVFNHTINALTVALQVAPILDDFYAGERLGREAEQHEQRLWTLMMTRDGSMMEVGDEGHMIMPTRTDWMYLQMLREPHPPAWFTPAFRAKFESDYRVMLSYLVRHITPGGNGHRMTFQSESQRELHLDDLARFFVTDPQHQKTLALGYHNTPLGEVYQPLNLYNDPEVQRVLETVYGTRKDLAAKFKRPYPGKPTFTSDWMPYIGLYYLRREWKPDASFIHMICQPDGGSSNGQLWNTRYAYWDYGFPLAAADPIMIDGQPQYPMAGRLGLFPGSKTDRIVEAPEKPANDRWLSSDRYDVAECAFVGTYENRKIDKQLHTLVEDTANKITGVHTQRQIIQVRPYRLFIVTNRVSFAHDAGPHTYTMPATFYLTQKEGASYSLSPLHADPATRTLRLDNPDSPGLLMHQFGAQHVSYRVSNGRPPRAQRGDPFPGFAIGTAGVEVKWKATGDNLLLTLLDPSRAKQAPTLTHVTERGDGKIASGFRGETGDGGSVEYLAAVRPPAHLRLGNLEADAEALLLVRTPQGASGVALGVKRMTSAGAAVPLDVSDFEFDLRGNKVVVTHPALRPIDPVRVEPNASVFTDAVEMKLVSDTPGVEVRYTLDGSEPTPSSTLYTGPVRLTESTFVRARAYRPGVRENPFETCGTRATAISYAQFTKQQPLPAVQPDHTLRTGLHYDYLEGTWFKLYSYADHMEAALSGTTTHLFDVSMRKTDGPFGVRYTGYIQIPADGLYTFFGPPELVHNIAEPGYDLRLWIDGRQWYLGQEWHGLGRWSIPLLKGSHRFAVTFADARAKDIPHQRPDLWRGYPNPWVVWRGKTPTIDITGPGIAKQPIPDAWFKY